MAAKISVFGNFKIEVVGVSKGTTLLGYRVTTHDQTTGLQHDFYVHEGEIRHVQFQSSPPWSYSTPFVVGNVVKRIMDSERRAIMDAIREFAAGVLDEDDGS